MSVPPYASSGATLSFPTMLKRRWVSTGHWGGRCRRGSWICLLALVAAQRIAEAFGQLLGALPISVGRGWRCRQGMKCGRLGAGTGGSVTPRGSADLRE
jgi:hypothetical protein